MPAFLAGDGIAEEQVVPVADSQAPAVGGEAQVRRREPQRHLQAVEMLAGGYVPEGDSVCHLIRDTAQVLLVSDGEHLAVGRKIEAPA
jgi:hypothetical protein